MEEYTQIIANINTIIWAFSKNKMFLDLSLNNDEFKYFFKRIKEVFIKNIDYFNARELMYSLNGLIKLINTEANENEEGCLFSKDEKKIVGLKIMNLEKILPHEACGLLKVIFNFY